jgi:hypothetical protein
MKKIRTEVLNIFKDQQLDVDGTKGVMDVSFENIGITDVTILTLGGKFTLTVGSPMLTFGGYEGYYRSDNLRVRFVGGTGSLNVYMNIHSNLNNC